MSQRRWRQSINKRRIAGSDSSGSLLSVMSHSAYSHMVCCFYPDTRSSLAPRLPLCAFWHQSPGCWLDLVQPSGLWAARGGALLMSCECYSLPRIFPSPILFLNSAPSLSSEEHICSPVYADKLQSFLVLLSIQMSSSATAAEQLSPVPHFQSLSPIDRSRIPHVILVEPSCPGASSHLICLCDDLDNNVFDQC